MDPLISVIVPIYKVENYLDECIQSIINQTYKNLEIILVDDGSPDRCPAICDKYAEIDHRVVVIHKQNGGVCSARNAALSIAKGDYIGFVDGDDYIDSSMYEALMNACAYSGAGLAYSNFLFVDNTGQIKYNCEEWHFDSSELLSSDTFMYKILKNEIFCSVWNKLFRADLIRKFFFRSKNEDALFCFETALRMIYKHVKAISVPSYLYFYRYNPLSLTNIRFSILTHLDILENSSHFVRCLEDSNNSSLLKIAKHRYYSHLLGLNMAIMNNYEYQFAYKSYLNRLKDIPFVYVNEVLGFRHRLAFYILRFCPILWTINEIKIFCTKRGIMPPIA